MREPGITEASAQVTSSATGRIRHVLSVFGGGYDVFISYTQAEPRDVAFARALKRGFERLAKPWFKRRALSVFLDESGIGAQGGLAATIRKALERSRHYVLISSPVAARRPWIIEESRVWFDVLHRAEPPSILLVSGEFAWDAAVADVDWVRTDALPSSLMGRWREEPYVVDGRRLVDLGTLDLRNPGFALLVAKLAAPLHGVEPGDLIGQDVREHRRTRLIASLAAALILGLAVAAGFAAFAERAARRDAELRLADSEVFEAGVRLARGDTNSAERLLLVAADGYRALGVSDLPASFGLFRLHLERRFPLLAWQAHQGRAYSVAFAPDGCCVYSAGEDGAIRRFHLDQPDRVDVLHPPDGVAVRDFALSGDGNVAAAGRRDGSVIFWRDLGTEPTVFRMHGGSSPDAVALSGSALYAGGSDGAISVWSLTTGESVRYDAHKNRITSMRVAANSKTVLSGSIDNTARAWAPDSPEALTAPIWSIPNSGPIEAVAIQPELPWVVVAGADGLVHFWNLETHKERIGPVSHGEPVFALAVDAEGEVGISGDIKGRALLWDQATATGLAELVASRSTIFGAALTPDGKLAATADGDGRVYLWATASPVRRTVAPKTARPTALAISEDGLVAAGGDERGLISIWSSATGETLRTLKAHVAPIRLISLCLACGDVVTAADDRSIVRIDMLTGKILWRGVTPAAITALGRDRAGHALVGLATGAVISETATDATPTSSGEAIVAISVAPDGDIVSVDTRGTVQIGSKTLTASATKQSLVTASTVSPRADTILLGRADGSLTLIANRTERLEIPASGAKIIGLALAEDGRTTLVLSETFDLTLWNVADRRQLETVHLSVHPGFNSRVDLASFASASPALVVFAGDAAPEILDLSVAERLSGRGPSGTVALTDADRLAMNGQWAAAASRLSPLSPMDLWRLNAVRAARLSTRWRHPAIDSVMPPPQYLELLDAPRSR